MKTFVQESLWLYCDTIQKQTLYYGDPIVIVHFAAFMLFIAHCLK